MESSGWVAHEGVGESIKKIIVTGVKEQFCFVAIDPVQEAKAGSVIGGDGKEGGDQLQRNIVRSRWSDIEEEQLNNWTPNKQLWLSTEFLFKDCKTTDSTLDDDAAADGEYDGWMGLQHAVLRSISRCQPEFRCVVTACIPPHRSGSC